MNNKDLPTLAEVFESWRLNLGSPNTVRAYRGVILGLRRWAGSDELGALSEVRLEAFVGQISNLRMKQRAVTALHSFYGYLLDVGIINSDPARRIFVRRFKRITNEELLTRLGLKGAMVKRVRWSDVFVASVSQTLPGIRLRLREGPDSKELHNRLVAQLRSCHDVSELRAILRKRVARTLVADASRRKSLLVRKRRYRLLPPSD